MKNLKKLRLSQNLTTTELGKIIGCSNPTITHYERGDREPSIDMLCKLADFFDVTVDYLIGHNTALVSCSSSVNVFAEKYGELCSDKYFCAYAELHKLMNESQKIFTLGMIVGYLREQGVSVSLNLP